MNAGSAATRPRRRRPRPRARRVLPAGEQQLDHARQVGAEALVRGRALERRVAAAASRLALAVEAEVVGRRDQDVVDEDRRVARHAEALRELRVAVVLRDEARLAAELRDDALCQQTCRIGEVSGVRPAHERDGDAGRRPGRPRGSPARARRSSAGSTSATTARPRRSGARAAADRGERPPARLSRKSRPIVWSRPFADRQPRLEARRARRERPPSRARAPARAAARRAGPPAGSAAARRSAGRPRRARAPPSASRSRR